MRWQNKRLSDNVEDRRGGGGGMRTVGIGGGIGGIIIIVLALLFNKDPQQVLQQVQSGAGTTTESAEQVTAGSDETARFASTVLALTEDVWTPQFNNMHKTYTPPRMVLFSTSTDGACGFAQSAMGPFYCPADAKVYLDLSFFNEMQERFNVAGDFAVAYVIAHEVGHHVQNLLGISSKVQAMRSRLSQTEYNKLSVKLELQADFLAGVWAHHARRLDSQLLESGDMEEALNAASAVGDDKLQQATQGRVVPDAFTHGTSAQRMHWFKKGFDSGDLQQGDTFQEQ